jgi:hypothetical protein
LRGGQSEHDLRARHIGLNRRNGKIDDFLHTHCGCEMKNDVTTIDQFGHPIVIENGIVMKRKIAAVTTTDDVFDAATREIIDHSDFMS